ncbi:DUF3291 domain-containing protein [Peribacillus sp. SCS-155]|uniref:DUF3291 domain-containing protein n=1 Tax=Peribacillus sedimenti TaxID=3115297 RepID=UPI003905E371
MAFVVSYTVGRLKHPYEHPASREFFEVGYQVLRQAAISGNLLEEFSPEGVPLPEEVNNGDGYPILTLTVWKNLESLRSFTYSGKHMRALRDRDKWIEPHKGKHPSYVVWWTDKMEDVSWEEASKRYKNYIQHGPTPFSFDYKHAFDYKGERLLFN